MSTYSSIRSGEMNDMLEKNPPILMKWGLLAMLSFIVSLFFLGSFIQIPVKLEMIGTIISTKETEEGNLGHGNHVSYRAISYISERDLGKLHLNQKARILIDGSTNNTRGYLEGYVVRTAANGTERKDVTVATTLNPSEGNLNRVEIGIAGPLRTNRNYIVSFVPGMHCQTTIVLRKESLLNKLFASIVKLQG